MDTSATSITELLDSLRPNQALCAFNTENFDTLKPALWAAADLECPVVVAFTVPAAKYLGFPTTARIVDTLAKHYGVRYALHLDHCEKADDLTEAVDGGFTSANLLDEGSFEPGTYVPIAQKLRQTYRERISLEFVFGKLGHIEDGHGHGLHHEAQDGMQSASVEEVLAFNEATSPDILGFDCGSLHGMKVRDRGLDLDLIGKVAAATGKPIVLHGSSGVREDALVDSLDAGVRKVNIETAIRAVYMESVRRTVQADGDGARKPRYLTKATDEALHHAYSSFLRSYTLRLAQPESGE